MEGGSTHVYRITFQHETFYLRILPEEGASFAPEITVLKRLQQMHVKVPEVVYFEDCNATLRRSIMVMTEIKGRPLNQSHFLPKEEIERLVMEAGQDLARINTMAVDGFGWVTRSQTNTTSVCAAWPTYRAFALEYWEADLAYLGKNVLTAKKVAKLEHILTRYDSWLDAEKGHLAHGDFDTTHIFQDNGQYTGIIDFGEIRGANCWYDIAHFHMRDGELLPYQLLPALVRGYEKIIPMPPEYEQHIRFTSMLINVRALSRALQKCPPDQYTQHQLEVLQEDLTTLL